MKPSRFGILTLGRVCEFMPSCSPFYQTVNGEAMVLRIDVGSPACAITKCRPFGVVMPCSRWCGVRACCVRGSPLGLLSVRAAALSNLEGTP